MFLIIMKTGYATITPTRFGADEKVKMKAVNSWFTEWIDSKNRKYKLVYVMAPLAHDAVLFNSLRPSDAYMRQYSNHYWLR